MCDAAAIVKGGILLAFGGVSTGVVLLRLTRAAVRFAQMECELLRLEEEVRRAQERLRSRLRS